MTVLLAQTFLDNIPWWVIALVKTAVILFVVLTTFAYAMVFERKIMAWMQLRPGPNRVGPWGMMQPAADAVKMLFKEDLTPNTADPVIYKLAPFISLICAMGAFAIIPFSESGGGIWGVSDVNAGILALFAITSIGVYGISLAGWASGSKFPLLGSVRSTAQMISYELAMTMSIVGVLGGAGMTNEEIVLLAEICDALGIGNRDWRTGRQVQASPGPLGGAYADLERAQLIVAIGRPPSQTAPVMDLRIRKAVARGGAAYVVVGDHAPASFVEASHVARVADIGPHLDGVERVAFVWDGIDPEAAHAAELIESLLAKGTTVHTFVPGEFANARGAEALGLMPRAGALDAGGIVSAALAGKLRVLALLGADPMLTHPAGRVAIEDALEHVEFVVATGLFLTQTTALANLVLPVRGAFEKAGHAFDLTGGTSELDIAQFPPAGTLAEGDVLVALAAELGLTVSAPQELIARATTLPESAYAFADPKLARENDGAAATSGDLRIAIAASVFAGGDTSYFDERFAPQRPQPTAVVHPQTAGATLEAGALVDLVAGDRRVSDLVVVYDDAAVPGVVVVFDGLPEAPVNAFASGESVRFDNVRVAQRELAGGVA
jgi:hypothetical protein